METTPQSRDFYVTQMGLLNYALAASTCLVAPQQGLDGLLPLWGAFTAMAVVTASQMHSRGDTRPLPFRVFDCTVPFAHTAFGAAMASMVVAPRPLATLSIILGSGLYATMQAQGKAVEQAEVGRK